MQGFELNRLLPLSHCLVVIFYQVGVMCLLHKIVARTALSNTRSTLKWPIIGAQEWWSHDIVYLLVNLYSSGILGLCGAVVVCTHVDLYERGQGIRQLARLRTCVCHRGRDCILNCYCRGLEKRRQVVGRFMLASCVVGC